MNKNYRAEITGCFGDPVDDNPTGVMEEAAFAACGLNYRYLTLKVTKENFDDAMKSIRALGMKGMNFTMPHKITVLSYLDEISEAARIIGAVNTVVVKEDGKLFGENTDGKGFVQALKNKDVSLTGKNVVILGAGGAAKAIGVECALSGAAQITIVNRSLAKGEVLANMIASHTPAKAQAVAWAPAYKIPSGTDILINATCIGFSPNVTEMPDLDYSTINATMVVSDVVFNPCETLFLKEAGRYGAKVVNGLGMLACQGALNFTLWTGIKAPLDVMEETLRKEFE